MPARVVSVALKHLSGGLGWILVACVLVAYLVLALAPFRWVPPRRAPNGARAEAAGLVFPAPGLARSGEAPGWLAGAAELGTLALDLRIRTYDPARRELGRIFTVSRDYHFRNLTVDQDGPDLIVRLRRPGSTPNGKPPYRLAGVLGDREWHEVQILIAPGRLGVRIDGRVALTRVLPDRPLVDWDRRYLVAVGNELHGNRPWRGEVACAVVEVDGERIDYARPGRLNVPERFWAFANSPTWLFEDYVYPDSVEDWLANFIAFVPLGFLLAALGRTPGSWRRALVACAIASLVVEVAQGLFSRHPATIDWVLNTLGGGAGGAIAAWLASRVPDTSSRTSARALSLLRAVSDDQAVLPAEAFDERSIRWVVATGLGPLLLRAAGERPGVVRPPIWSLVQAADLTARVITAEQIDAMTEIIDACRGRVPPLVLLKGISICEQYYPEPHLRPMRDIDVLVEREALPEIEAILFALGYCQPPVKPAVFYETHHHRSPFFHPGTGVWVDVHHALVPATSELGSDEVFSVEHLQSELRPSQFRGRRVRRLSDELQIVHVSCHWAHRLRRLGGMVAMVDMTYLLTRAPAVQWPHILEWTKDSVAARYVYLLLAYVVRRRLVELDPDVLHRLRLTQNSLDRISVEIGHALVDGYVVGGRELGSLVSDKTLGRLWNTLVLHRPPSRRLGLAPVVRRHASRSGGQDTNEEVRP